MTAADHLLSVFQQKQSQYLISATISPQATVESLRASSTVLFTAVMLVAALLVPGKEALHETCHGNFMGLVSSVMFDRVHTLDDIRGLCIAALWEPCLSWKLSGLCIRMATELNLHHAFHSAFHEISMSQEDRKEQLERARLWYLLYVLDHRSSIAYGRPPVMSELRPIKEFEMLLTSDLCTNSDRALIAELTGLVALSRAFDTFGLEPRRAMTGDEAAVLDHSRFADNIQTWRDRWNGLRAMDQSNATLHLLRSVELQYHFSNLVLNSLVLRGRSLQEINALPASLRPLALKAVEAAHMVLQHFLDNPTYADEIAGMPLYLHSIIPFSVVFLMKLARRWNAIGITIDAPQRTFHLIERVIRLLQNCQVGSDHMIYSMAKGFDRMFRRVKCSDDVGTSSTQ
ncbi:Transcriptional activator of proteases prtT [Fulvia fulva]|uniref:Transcriptional activator of proteases prtT n=1 Tax=Passalora fulva TaxID=5499 RepID=A0A9Q8LD19_PASFU|nr:Transcriptional activator of proteases prtT [Fulvia fulva]KAK4629557.1 Transcriptional activator of proteases prtT [Fulvia fulva]KAK4630629.1 Transcriptional activator of proteases prtT [Fulvia fulva]UJO15162.1 Transcriptional activator of proteases prtT [Fulvia fulva]WPV12449.1 Transcriptional activator of proteases prtT [Fulvia fulva]WPV27701.1 Transcriptional activator of proteases prtT [Fulvia fulva]